MNLDKHNVLDHGYIQLVDHYGSDERIIEAARMSTNKGFLGWEPSTYLECTNTSCPGYSYQGIGTTEEVISQRHENGLGMRCPNCSSVLVVIKEKSHSGDKKLLRYLWTHKHHTPFEMCGLSIEVQAPIFVFREWHRHRTQSYNEMSARYIQMPDLHYIPSKERILAGGQDSKNKQGSLAISLSDEDILTIQDRIRTTQRKIYEEYEILLGAYGLSKELARLNTPVSRYSRMRASANLRNWLHFLSLRMAPNAQWEIRQYADAVGKIISDLFPRTWELFEETFISGK